MQETQASTSVTGSSAHRDAVDCRHAADQAATPLLDAVATVAGRVHEVPLHIPGHKRGNGAHPRLRQAFGGNVFHHDLTELPGATSAASMGDIIGRLRCAAPHLHAHDHIRLMGHVLLMPQD